MNRLQRIADGNTERMVGKRRGMVMQKPSQKPCKHNIRQRLMEMDGDKSGWSKVSFQTKSNHTTHAVNSCKYCDIKGWEYG